MIFDFDKFEEQLEYFETFDELAELLYLIQKEAKDRLNDYLEFESEDIYKNKMAPKFRLAVDLIGRASDLFYDLAEIESTPEEDIEK